MTTLEALFVLVAGVGAGTINALVGSGTLITFPVLLAVGFPPLTANVSNSAGLVPGSVSGAYGYRRELRGQGGRVRRLVPATLLGSACGAALLLALPASAFEAIVPAFIALALVLVVLQPRISRRLARRPRAPQPHGVGRLALSGIFATGVYGGYFGAAQGIVLLAILGNALDEDLQRVNAVKNILSAVANGTAALIFVVTAHIAWDAVLLLAVGSTAGGQLGAHVGRRLPAAALRGVIVLVGLAAIVKLLVS